MPANPELFEALPLEPEATKLLKGRKINAQETVALSVAISLKRFVDLAVRTAPPARKDD
jgi:hypothetical protein